MTPTIPAFAPIGVIHSPFREKFGIPRQSGLVPSARSQLELLPPYDDEAALRGLEAFSHLWISFVFHATADQGWRPTVRPPRLGGNARVGVFATRSTFRPNPLGLSVVRHHGWSRREGKLMLDLQGTDLMDGTPVLDIKPYLPWADTVAEAEGGFAPTAPEVRIAVVWEAAAREQLSALNARHPGLERLVEEVLACDPRPAYQRKEGRAYGMRLHDFNLRWRMSGDTAVVIALEPDDE